MTPRQLSQRARAEFRESADPRVAEGQRAYFKKWEKVHFHGLKTPEQRRIERTLYHEVREQWTFVEAVELCEELMPDRYLESKGLALTLLARFHRRFERGLLRRAKGWLERGFCDNWAVTDQLSTQILSRLIEKFEPLAATVESWDKSPNLWVRRACAVSFVKAAARGRHLDRVYRIVTVLEPDTQDLIHKACGWLLREAGKGDPARLERHLSVRGPAIPRTTMRYAIERFPEQKRKQILEDTRVAGRKRL